ncbi:TrbI/VirB10 family protein [Nostoc sp. PCC 7107]|uniref:TrbI/VirB10 family protein n=1 Tax=Nostoc sp. PCC 7107 TaxID=317936 RepID=UPI00029F4E43|nr:TrbI/VirB10 family protein [Nostoc sp. PCC 7107]AFY45053.1 hypothetical protein Nos7107_4522 [Nostoc sp. PCC 7107]
MTSYSISSELSSQSLVNRPHSDSQKQTESADWESKIARLVGFEDESKTVNVEATEESDIPEALTSEPEEVKTTQPLSANPFAKLTLVGSATLVVVLLAGGFLSQLMSGSSQKSNSNVVSVPTPSTTTTAPRQQDLQQEIEDLKTKLALAEQADEVAASQQNLRNPVRLVSSVDPRPNRTTTVRNVRPAVQTPAQVVYIPRPINPAIERPAVVSAIPESRTEPQFSPPPQPVVNTPPAPPDPLQEWSKLAKLGSYGQVSTTGTSGVNISQVPPANNNDTVTSPEITQPQTQPQPQTNPGLSPGQTQGPKTVAVGTSTRAVVATAIFGETTRTRGNDKDDEDKNVFVIQLKQPLKSIDGEVAIPAKTELLAEIKSLSDQGLLQLNVTKIVSQKDGVITETTLPRNAIIIRGVKGRPLIANKFPNAGGAIASMDLGLFVLGGIGKAAELFNRTEAQVVTTTATGTIISNTNPRTNILAGVLEGGFNSVVPQISQRNQQAIAQLTQQTNVWFIAAGKEVEVYVNQQLQF